MNRFIVRPNKSVKEVIDLNINMFDIVVLDNDENILYSCSEVIQGNFTVNYLDPVFNSQGQALVKVDDVVRGDNDVFIVKGLNL